MSFFAGPVLLRSEVIITLSFRDITQKQRGGSHYSLHWRRNCSPKLQFCALTHPFSYANPFIHQFTQEPPRTLPKPRIATLERLKLFACAPIRNLHRHNRTPICSITTPSSSSVLSIHWKWCLWTSWCRAWCAALASSRVSFGDWSEASRLRPIEEGRGYCTNSGKWGVVELVVARRRRKMERGSAGKWNGKSCEGNCDLAMKLQKRESKLWERRK